MNIAQDAIIIQKTPIGEWDVTIDWGCPSRDLGPDTIFTSEWAAQGTDNALVLSDPSISTDEKSSTIWISGGTQGIFYTVTNTITTTDERVLTGTFLVQLLEYVFLTQPHFI